MSKDRLIAAITAFVVVTSPLVMACVYRWWQSRCKKKTQFKDGQSQNQQSGTSSTPQSLDLDTSVETAQVSNATSNNEFSTEISEAEIEETVSCSTVNSQLYAQPRKVETSQECEPSMTLSNLIGKDKSEIMACAAGKGLDFPFLVNKKTQDYMEKPEAKVMFIMRGLSGSGKSTIVDHIQSFYKNVVVCSADDFFYRRDGSYEFNPDKLSRAHGTCQQNARDACGKGTSIVVIDNTNVKRWEMRVYFETAKLNGYVVILVEPKTPWKFDAKALARKNKHGVELKILERKVKTFDDVIPLYYAWFLNESASRQLQDLADHLFRECLKVFPEFKRTLLRQYASDHPGHEKESEDEALSRYYDRSGKSSPLLHCTSHFCNNGKIADAKAYHQRKDVQKSYGQVHTLTVSGLTLTTKTLGARISLDRGYTSLYVRPEEMEWKGMKVELRARETKEKKKEKSPKSKSKIAPTSKRRSKNEGDVSSQLSKVSLRDGDEDGATAQGDSDPVALTSLFPRLNNTGHARSAHITLKTAKGVESKETNFDVLTVCDIEDVNFNSQSQPALFPVQRGQACYYGDGICCVYFQRPIDFDALYSGYY